MAFEIKESFLSELSSKFPEFLRSETGIGWVKEREEKDRFFHTHFNEEAIKGLDEGILRQLLNKLWAFSGWANKDYLLEQMLESGLLKINTAFHDLLYGTETLPKRFDKMRNIKVMGAASISEILSHHDHQNYAIWNRKAKAGLIKMGVKPEFLPKSSQISGKQYVEYCSIVKSIVPNVFFSYV